MFDTYTFWWAVCVAAGGGLMIGGLFGSACNERYHLNQEKKKKFEDLSDKVRDAVYRLGELERRKPS